MKERRSHLIGWRLFLFAMLACPSVRAGKLATFEADATAPSVYRPTGDRHCDSCLLEIVDQIFVELAGHGMFFGGACSWARVTGKAGPDMDYEPRRFGEPLLPFLRLDVAYQEVVSDVAALDVRAEAGFGPIGLHFNQTSYSEDAPADDLVLTRFFVLYRMSFGSHVQTDLGFGSLFLDGNEEHTKFAACVPVLVHPCEFVGVEFRPAWSERVTDYDLAVLLSLGPVSLKGGYRWVRSPNEWLDGPYAGVSVRW